MTTDTTQPTVITDPDMEATHYGITVAHIGDDGEGLVWKAYVRRVPLHHLDARIAAEARPQLSQRSRIELDGTHACAGVRKRPGQGTAAGAEVEHERPGLDGGVADELVCEGAATKGVATAWPRLR